MNYRSLITSFVAVALVAACSSNSPPKTTHAPDDSAASDREDHDEQQDRPVMASGAAESADDESRSPSPTGPESEGASSDPPAHVEGEEQAAAVADTTAQRDRLHHDELVPCFRFDGPRVIVLMIGDGLGPEQVRAGRLAEGHELSFEKFPVQGTMTTESADNEVTDSAASATAMSTGRKVNNYVVAEETPGDGLEMETVLEAYQRCGRRVGMVTTSRVTHATPASFGAHHHTRWEEQPILQDYLLGYQMDLIVGGGLRGVDAAEIREAGFQLIRSASDFLALSPPLTSPTMVLLGDSHLPYVADDAQEDEGLAALADKALALLDDGERSVFLMVEGARIDHAGHNNDFDRMWPEVVAFHHAAEAVAERYRDRDDYLLLVTADHETGGLQDVQRDAETGALEGRWTTEHHTAVPVGYYAIGDVPDEAPAVIDNTDIYDILRGEWPSE